jgi:histidinol-phosphate aminotransferase
LDENFHIRKEDYYKENGGVVIANPNAPTSICEDLSVIEDMIRHNQDSVVIIDEAYIDFGGESAKDLISKYENLLVVQTFSKSRSMAGMRIGYAMGNPALIKALNDVKYSFNSYTINQTAIMAGVEAVKDKQYFDDCNSKIVATRKKAESRFKELGFTFPESSANFLFVTHESVPAKVIFDALRASDIYVRYFNLPRINNYLRVTIGTEEEMENLFTFLDRFLRMYIKNIG